MMPMDYETTIINRAELDLKCAKEALKDAELVVEKRKKELEYCRVKVNMLRNGMLSL